jgi:hypothetical protein
LDVVRNFTVGLGRNSAQFNENEHYKAMFKAISSTQAFGKESVRYGIQKISLGEIKPVNGAITQPLS